MYVCIFIVTACKKALTNIINQVKGNFDVPHHLIPGISWYRTKNKNKKGNKN